VDPRLRNILFKKINVATSKEVKPGCNQAESSMEGYGSKRAVLPMMMIIMIMCCCCCCCCSYAEWTCRL
jgi:phage gp36-like protein